ncbi:hypothetical protein THIX_10453 [Thiomonas sp. X19]|uniref:hypothetical protein n=1 Tax=Thiomonas sp. X19 TaxID=1050370 RepID=UPI000B6243F6|nr:hypothetical protein [Thiomonas sp. X19]SCC91412.1 hypothetical protein THIX_10453 [Thiomonas sp. X19]
MQSFSFRATYPSIRQPVFARNVVATAQPGFAAAFMPDGRAPEIGETWRFPAAARALQPLA